MDAAELRALLKKPEWHDIELKKAENKFPDEAISTICAYANSGGGYLILGVDEKQLPEISGITDVDTVQNDAINVLKDTQKFNVPITYDQPHLIDIDDKKVIVIPIQDSLRQQKPVKVYLKLKGKKDKSWVAYLRKGACDVIANDNEITRMMIDSGLTSPTDHLLDVDVETCFEPNTLKWYRRVFESRHQQKHFELSHVEFLDALGLIREQDDELKPTVASILMFGTEKYVRQILPRFTLDVYWHHFDLDDDTEGERWNDRRTYDCNLFDTWRQLAERFMYYAEQPFQIDETNLQRNNEPPDYIGFREAAVNVLIHQDYSDKSRAASIHFYKNASIYKNSGDSLIEVDRLGKGDSDSRNPLIMQTFHRIGLSDTAGSGIKAIYQNWQQLDRPIPEVINDKAHKFFQITLGKRAEVSKLQEQFMQRMGVHLSQTQAKVFAASLLQPLTAESLSNAFDLPMSDVYPALDHLNRQGLLISSPEGYQAQEHFREPLSEWAIPLEVIKQDQESDQATEKVTKLPQYNQVSSDQVVSVLARLNKKQQLVISGLDGEMKGSELLQVLGQTHKTYFKNKQLQPVIDLGLVAEKYPDTPRHPDQAYFLTHLGQAVKNLINES
ncbi:MAG: putative DNA binding domain-containing protein [Hahellaceae bacterium]|nr:putative DNA binding domain-containing protein [Hahellaceae bacterium]MCP5210025.1 putative DNA binding domain-containing protein [Hahellaceae bacterium]